ncbi:MAG TPA: DUF169 domain-containing protein [Dehalococcoidia bacterium]|jgi:uncharacterized protein (DUF169 family)
MTDWTAVAARLTSALHLDAPPIAITFSDAVPHDIRAFDEPFPDPTDDDRTGRVPAGCVFWMKSVDRTFTTVAEDHANCSVGSLTHGFIDLATAATRGDVAALVESGWVTPDIFPSIPSVAQRPGAIIYGPLANATCEPDVVLLRLNAAALMTVSDAVPGLRIEGKPQCHIVAVAKEERQIVASVGCALSRARTGMRATDMTCAIPGSQAESLATTLDRTRAVDGAVATYAGVDARRFA